MKKYLLVTLEINLGYDNSLDCFGMHGVGNSLGAILPVFFLRKGWVASQGADWSLSGPLATQLNGTAATVAS